MTSFSNEEQQSVNRIVDALNRKRQAEFAQAMDPRGEVRKWVEEQRKAKFKRTGKAGWVKIASVPLVVDQFFVKLYGNEYYKDKDFFEHYPEWKVVEDTRKI